MRYRSYNNNDMIKKTSNLINFKEEMYGDEKLGRENFAGYGGNNDMGRK